MFVYCIVFLIMHVTFLKAYSVTQLYPYPEFCRLASLDNEVFETFRGAPMFQLIVENLNYMYGVEFAERIYQQYPHLLPYMHKICKDDKIGDPEVYRFFPTIGSCSSVALRYVKIAGDLQRLFGDLSKFNIVEIGGGFGGQCKILHDITGFASYTIIDLPGSTNLIRKYLSYFNIKNIHTIDSFHVVRKSYDLVISNYALSEISRDEQLGYIKKIVNLAPRGYIIYNDQPSVNPLSVQEFITAISCANVTVEPEDPPTGEGAFLVRWDATDQ